MIRMTIGGNEFQAEWKANDRRFVEHCFSVWLAAIKDDAPAIAALTSTLSASTTRLATAVRKAGVAAPKDKDTSHG